MRLAACCVFAVLYFVSSGCVVVNPKGDVHMSPWPESWNLGGKKKNQTAYGPSLDTVVKQQDKIVKKLQKQDWTGLLDDTTKWTQDVRELQTYANTTYDPARFHQYCDNLLVQTQTIRDAALRQDPVACNAALHNCDPILDRMSRDFPTNVTVIASPPPAPAPAPMPGARPSVHTSVNVNTP
jgi:hypothetical protein